MRNPAPLAAAMLAIAAALAAAPSGAQERQVYRYVDGEGKVVYSDRPPQGEVKSVTAKRLGGNFVETSEPSYATQQASAKYPVTLYTFGCGEPCQNAEALLNARGVPFAKVNVEEEKGAQKLQELTGELSAPVMTVGDRLIAKGFNDARWTSMLDEAGYPKSPPKRIATKLTEPPAAPKVDRTDAREGPAPGTNVMVLPAQGGGYPK